LGAGALGAAFGAINPIGAIAGAVGAAAGYGLAHLTGNSQDALRWAQWGGLIGGFAGTATSWRLLALQATTAIAGASITYALGGDPLVGAQIGLFVGPLAYRGLFRSRLSPRTGLLQELVHTGTGTGRSWKNVGPSIVERLFYDRRAWQTIQAARDRLLLGSRYRPPAWNWEHLFVTQTFASRHPWLLPFANSYANTFLKVRMTLNSSLGARTIPRLAYWGPRIAGLSLAGLASYLLGRSIGDRIVADY
jgi:hypothetical protein